MAPLRLRHSKGVSSLDVDADATVAVLQQQIFSVTDIPPSAQICKTGYPPRPLTLVPELPVSSLGLRPGDQIIVSESASAPAPVAPPPVSVAAPAPVPSASASGPASVETQDGSHLVHRIVPDDNSCLFSSIALIFHLSNPQTIRKFVADGIQRDPQTYNEAILGMSPDKYISTILKPSTWGGAIELSILANHFNTEIDSIDVETGRVDQFEPAQNSSGNRCVLVYSGIHYDAATLAPMVDAPADFHQTVFPIRSTDSNSDPVLIAAKKLADILRAKRAFTNTSTFDLKCEQCGVGLKGEKGARAHAEQTGHTRIRYDISHLTHSFPIHLFDTQDRLLLSRSSVASKIEACLLDALQHDPSLMQRENNAKVAAIMRFHGRYAILSHTWANRELGFRDVNVEGGMGVGSLEKKEGYAKLDGMCRVAGEFMCRYVWFDAVCIDKSNTMEMEETIHSMWKWYQNAYICIVHLSNTNLKLPSYPANSSVSPTGPRRRGDSKRKQLKEDPWFRRGWTLPELLAPKRIKFYLGDWTKMDQRVGRRFDICRVQEEGFDFGAEYVQFLRLVADAATVPVCAVKQFSLRTHSAPEVFHWISKRITTRPEDLSYCLMGMLDIHIPIIYGEGHENAFYRLQSACLQSSPSRLIFHWFGMPSPKNSMIAADPSAFKHTGTYEGYVDGQLLFRDHMDIDTSFVLTNAGLRMMVTLFDVRVVSVHPYDEMYDHFRCAIFEDDDTEILALKAHRAVGTIPRSQVGVYADGLAVLLGKQTQAGHFKRYSRVEFKRLPSLVRLSVRRPQVVFIT
ncbi:hypothetical protein ONZ45_g3573 [Pleurotus djamor]|nr:hypothetical protein ONZ45_g3573 [Pleurotus djamor]